MSPGNRSPGACSRKSRAPLEYSHSYTGCFGFPIVLRLSVLVRFWTWVCEYDYFVSTTRFVAMPEMVSICMR